MKLLVLILAVIAFVNGYPSVSEFDADIFDVNELLRGDTQETIQCVADGIKKLVADNPHLQSWFDDVQETSLKMIDGFEKCQATSGIGQTRCYLKLQMSVLSDVRRLLKLLPEGNKDFLDQAIKSAKECLQNN